MIKGSIFDVIFLGVLAFSTIVGGYILYFSIDQAVTPAGTALIATGANATVTNAATAGARNFASGFLNGIPLGLVIGGIVIIFLASTIPVPIILLPIGILMLLAAVVFFVFLDNATAGILANSFFTNFTTTFPLADALVRNLTLFALVIGAAVLFVMFGRGRTGGAPEG